MEITQIGAIQGSGRSLLAEQVADRINEFILEQNLKAGDKLPNEFELCEQLNVGRGTIREAEKILAARNILTIQRGRGTFIAEKTGEIEDPLGLAYRQDHVALARDLLEIRLEMEPWIASVAAQRATEEDLERMVRQCDLVEKLILKGEDHLEEDKRFHKRIADCTHNEVIPKLIPIITFSVSLFGRLSRNTLQQETVVQHRAIANAICSHDPETARKAMQEHVLSNKKRIEEMKE